MSEVRGGALKEILFYAIPCTLLLYLGAGAFIDLRKHEIPVFLPAAAFVAGLALQLLAGEMKWFEILLGCVPGGALLLLSAVTRQAVGFGDGLTLAAAGVYLGLFGTCMVLLLSLLAAAVTSLILVAAKKKKKKEEIPFLPFTLAGYVLLLVIG